MRLCCYPRCARPGKCNGVCVLHWHALTPVKQAELIEAQSQYRNGVIDLAALEEARALAILDNPHNRKDPT